MTVERRLRELERAHAQHYVSLRDALECARVILQAVKQHCPDASIAAVRQDIVTAMEALTLKRLK